MIISYKYEDKPFDSKEPVCLLVGFSIYNKLLTWQTGIYAKTDLLLADCVGFAAEN